MLPLHDPAASDPRLVGAKAANLSRLLAAGFAVPDGIVVTTDAFASHLGGTPADPQDGERRIPGTAIPEPVAHALADALAPFGDLPLAVRSSGVAEDLTGASFAGQYETVLGVRGHDAVLDAVARCWASAFSQRVAAYRGARDAEEGLMGVLIQPLIQPEAAGVAFTVNPLTGDATETAVSAVRGLGERLVSGEASPDEWTVRDGQALCLTAPEEATGAPEVLAIADLARRIEAHFGTPQDIEWAIRDGDLFLLQARPITTLPDTASPPAVPLPIDPPPGYWEREVSHFPQQLSPLFGSFLLEPENQAFRRFFEELSLLLETIELREIGGYVYQRVVPLGGKDRKAPPAWLWKLLVRTAPPLRSRVRGCVEAIRADKLWRWVESWHSEWKAELIDRATSFRAVDLAGLDDDQLRRHVDDLDDWFRESFGIHMRINGAQNVLLAEFFFACRELLGWDEARSVELLAGLSDASEAPARALAELAGRVRTNPALGDRLQVVDGQTARSMADLDPGFGAALEDYLQQFGCRPIRYELTAPTVAETPEWALALLRDQVSQGYDPATNTAALAEKRTRLAAEARAALHGQPPAARERFDRELARAEKVYPLREEHAFYDSSTPIALMRYAALELGSRLAGRRQIEQRDDIFFLELDEARAALRDGVDRRELVRRRQGERIWALAHPGPASYGTPPAPPPSFAVLPPEARFAHEAIMWALERVFATATSSKRQADSRTLSGIGASAGTYTGPLRVILDESQFHKIQAGDVLVCPITSPVWSVLFPSIGALVTDSGGILSHSAIIAREYRIPAVVATGNATTLLRDGHMVTVDGSAGMVMGSI